MLVRRAIALLVAFLAWTAAPASATELRIDFTGFDFNFDGTVITDDGADLSLGVPNFDRIDSVDFYEWGVLVGSLNTTDGDDLFANMEITNIPGIPVAGGLVSAGGMFDFFEIFFEEPTNPLMPGVLFLNFFPLGTTQLLYSGGGILLTGVAANPTLNVQNLPFGLVLDPGETVQISFSGFLSNVTEGGGFVTGFDAEGPGTIRGSVPEPSGLVVLGLGALAWRRRRPSGPASDPV